jgi:serine protease inhibitor
MRKIKSINRTGKSPLLTGGIMRYNIPAVTIFMILSLLFSSCWTPTEPYIHIVSMRELTASEKEVVSSANSFGLKLLSKLSELEDENDNIFISPLSISMALGMVLHGARGESQQEMKEVLEFHILSIDEINRSYRGLIDLLPYVDPAVGMLIANSVWYRHTFPVLNEFIETNKKYFDAEVQALDFSKPDASRIMNNWVHKKTNGHIDKIVPDDIDPLTVMYLINAMYFKGDWTNRFDRKDTREADFMLSGGTTKKVQMMQQKSDFRMFISPEVNILELPYGDELFSMILVLPPRGVSIHEFTASITGQKWQDWMSMIPGEGRENSTVYLPRFTLEYEKSLPDLLKALGMERAFDPYLADLSGLYDQIKEPRNAFISDVMHKTFAEVNEEGTEAAAATSVEVGLLSMPPEFRVDRPFLMAIRENTSDTILFIGKIVDPESK